VEKEDVRLRPRFVVLSDAEGASPKMKNLMNTPIRRARDNCPRMNPFVKDRLLQEISNDS